MARTFTIVACLLAAGCADASFMFQQKEVVAVEQRAIRHSISLCKKFGHKEGSDEFTRCAEQRYDEYILNNR